MWHQILVGEALTQTMNDAPRFLPTSVSGTSTHQWPTMAHPLYAASVIYCLLCGKNIFESSTALPTGTSSYLPEWCLEIQVSSGRPSLSCGLTV